jgi:hypothetical protein
MENAAEPTFKVANGSPYNLFVKTAAVVKDFQIRDDKPSTCRVVPLARGQSVTLSGIWLQISDSYSYVIYKVKKTDNRSLIVTYDSQSKTIQYSPDHFSVHSNSCLDNPWLGSDGKCYSIVPSRTLTLDVTFYVANGSMETVGLVVQRTASLTTTSPLTIGLPTISNLDPGSVLHCGGIFLSVTRICGCQSAVRAVRGCHAEGTDLLAENESAIFSGPTQFLAGRALIVTKELTHQTSTELNMDDTGDGGKDKYKQLWLSALDGRNHCPTFYVANRSDGPGIYILASYGPLNADNRDKTLLLKKDYVALQGTHVEIFDFGEANKPFYSRSVKPWTSLIVDDRHRVLQTDPLHNLYDDAVWTVNGHNYKPWFR